MPVSPNPQYPDQMVTVLNNLKDHFYDNVSNNNALLTWLKSKGKMEKISGGLTIQRDLEYQENRSATWYSGAQQINTSPNSHFTAVTFPWRQLGIPVTITGLEELIHDGGARRYDLWKSRMKNAMKTGANIMSEAIHSDGMLDNGLRIGGLRLLNPTDPRNTVGGIDGNAWDFWRNQVFSFSAIGMTPGPNTIFKALSHMKLAVTRGTDCTDLYVADNTFTQYYWEYLDAKHRITRFTDKKSALYGSLEFGGAPFVCDGGLWGQAAPGIHCLNTDYLQFLTHRKRDFTALGTRGSLNQDAKTEIVGWAGNAIITNRKLQGRITA